METLEAIESAHTQLEDILDALDRLGLRDDAPIASNDGHEDEDEEGEDDREDENAVVNALSAVMEKALPRTIRNLELLRRRLAPNTSIHPRRNFQEAEIHQHIRSSLRVALPRFFSGSGAGTGFQYRSGGNPELNTTRTNNRDELSNMRQNYESWNTELYSELKLDKETIRIVEIISGSSDKIGIKLTKERLEDIKDKYEALSYVWGSSDPAQIIEVNGISLPVNPNLFAALRALRKPDAGRSIWIDAICINQADKRERSREVRKMGKIYGLAETVVVFLGPGLESISPGSVGDLFKALNEFGSTNALENPTNENGFNLEALFQSGGVDKYAVGRGFVELCLQPWWGRIWIKQEFYLAAKEPVWYWDRARTGNAALKGAIDQLDKNFEDLYAHGGSNSNFHSKIQTMLGDKSISQFRHDVKYIRELIHRRKKTHGYDIPRRLYRELSASATEPRDFVYGMLEIFDPTFRKLFVPDYFMSEAVLFSLLTVFLIQYEGWADLLWWYPYRFKDTEFPLTKLPSWLPDFTKRVNLGEGEILPQDELVVGDVQPKLMVVDHALHAEGYRLDSITGRMQISEKEGHTVLRDLWRFDQIWNRNQTTLHYVMTDEESNDTWLSSFLRVCRESFAQLVETDGISHSKGSLLEWAWNSKPSNNVGFNVAEFLPFLDILVCFAFRETGELLQLQEVLSSSRVLSDNPNSLLKGILEDIFNTRMSNTFRKILATDFLGACIFNWQSLSHVLLHLTTTSQWSQPDSIYWELIASPFMQSNPDMVRIRTTGVCSFLKRIFTVEPTPETVSRTDLYDFIPLCTAILLDSDNHTSFMRLVKALRGAGQIIVDIASTPQIQTLVEQLEAVNASVAARVRGFVSLTTQFRGRSFFWTEKGFHGLVAPGVECREDDVVLLLDGMSFPVVARDFDERTGSGKLVGCGLVQGVKLKGENDDEPRVPVGFALGEKTVFKFT